MQVGLALCSGQYAAVAQIESFCGLRVREAKEGTELQRMEIQAEPSEGGKIRMLLSAYQTSPP
jgi:hypothetical protein